MYAIGIDIGGTSVKAVVLGGGGPELQAALPPIYASYHDQRNSQPHQGLREVDGYPPLHGYAKSDRYVRPSISELQAAITQALCRTGCWANGELATVGLCLPGAVDASGIVVRSVNIPELAGQDPLALLQSVVLLPPDAPPLVRLTDAFAAGADVYLSQNRTDRLLAISLGTGVGAAVIDAGCKQLILHGESSGHFGQMDVSIDDGWAVPIGPDGGRGSLEAYIGLPALVKVLGSTDDHAIESLDARDLPLRALTRALRIAHAIYKPDAVVLLGGVGIRLRRALPELNAQVAINLTSIAKPHARIECGQHDYHAAAGCARWAARSVTAKRAS